MIHAKSNTVLAHAEEDQARVSLIEAAKVFADSVRTNAMLVANWGDGEGGYALEVVRVALIDAGVFRIRQPKRADNRKPVSAKTRKSVFERDAYRCVWCGTHLELTLDHKIPVSKGGGNDIENLQTMCMPCNSRKGVEVLS